MHGSFIIVGMAANANWFLEHSIVVSTPASSKARSLCVERERERANDKRKDHTTGESKTDCQMMRSSKQEGMITDKRDTILGY